MVITQTPFRMSFFGGGTDMPEFFNMHTGSVLSTTFDKYCYVVVRHLPPFFDYKSEFVYSDIERVSDINEIQHPAIRNAMSMLGMKSIRLSYEGDLPARTGLGTSSSFAVGMLNAFHALKGEYASKRQLADEAIYLERGLCAEAGGWQDQIAASFGGMNRIDFKEDGYEVKPLIISPARKRELNDRLLLFFTGFTRMSSDVQDANRITDKTRELQHMLELVDEAEAVLVDERIPLARFGSLLDYTWKLKRSLGTKISTDAIDQVYERACAAGAIGGKLLGAGGGGFVLLYVEPEMQESVCRELQDLTLIPFRFEDYGTRVVHFTPEQLGQGKADAA